MCRHGRAAEDRSGEGGGGKLLERLRFALLWGEHMALYASLPDDERPPEPEVPVWAEPAWRAWSELGSERTWVSVGMAAPMGGVIIQAKPGLIPWSKVHAWCDRARYGEGDREFVVTLVGALDREYLAHWARQQTKQKSEPPDDKLSRWDDTPEGA